MKKSLKVTLLLLCGIVAVLLAAVLVFVGIYFTRIQTMNSIEKLSDYDDGYNLYRMKVKYDYSLDDVINYDIKDNHSRMGVAISLIIALAIIFFISNPFKGLIYSQMILSIQLPFTIFLQVYLTSSEKVMGKYKNSTYYKIVLLTLGQIVTGLKIALFWSMI